MDLYYKFWRQGRWCKRISLYHRSNRRELIWRSFFHFDSCESFLCSLLQNAQEGELKWSFVNPSSEIIGRLISPATRVSIQLRPNVPCEYHFLAKATAEVKWRWNIDLIDFNFSGEEYCQRNAVKHRPSLNIAVNRLATWAGAFYSVLCFRAMNSTTHFALLSQYIAI